MFKQDVCISFAGGYAKDKSVSVWPGHTASWQRPIP